MQRAVLTAAGFLGIALALAAAAYAPGGAEPVPASGPTATTTPSPQSSSSDRHEDQVPAFQESPRVLEPPTCQPGYTCSEGHGDTVAQDP